MQTTDVLNKEPVFWKATGEKLSILSGRISSLLVWLGFRNGRINGTTFYARIKNKILKQVTKTDIANTLIHHVRNRVPEVLNSRFKRHQLEDKLLYDARNYLSPDCLSFLPIVELEPLRDTKDKAYFVFPNGIVTVTKDEISFLPMEQCSGYVWENQVIPREYITCSYTQMESEAEQFMLLVSGKDQQRFNALKSIVGFMLHTYKDPIRARCVIFMDQKVADAYEANGGTGKGLVSSYLSYARRTVTIDGKNLDLNSQFPWQLVDSDTQVVVIDDAKCNFDFEKMYSIITTTLNVNKKNKPMIEIPFDRSPKFLVSTNFSPKGTGGNSEKRRMIVNEFAETFNLEFTPENVFGHRLFHDWNDSEWDRFYAFIFSCVQLYFNEGIIAPPVINSAYRSLLVKTSPEFVEFLNGLVESVRYKDGLKLIHKKDAFNQFRSEYDYLKFKMALSPHVFTRWMKLYFRSNNISFFDHPKRDKTHFALEFPDNWYPLGISPDDYNNGPATGDEIQTETQEKTIDSVPHNYMLVDTPEKLDDLKQKLSQQSSFCFDVETTSVKPMSAELVCIAFCFGKHEAYCVPVPADREAATQLLKGLEPLFASEKITKIGHNIKYDMLVLKQYGIEVKRPLFDTIVADSLLNSEERLRNLKFLTKKFFGISQTEITDLIGENSDYPTMREVPTDELLSYACQDVDFTWQLKNIFEKELAEKNLMRYFSEIEMPLIHALVDMEHTGIHVSMDKLIELKNLFQAEQERISEKIFAVAGKKFNIGSVEQLCGVLFEDLGIKHPGKKTPKGNLSADKDVLEKIKNAHEIVPLLLEHRQLATLIETTIGDLIESYNPATGRIHTSILNFSTSTGRMTTRNPNIQGVPRHSERGKLIRSAFVAKDSDSKILGIDYSQVELRLLAHFSGDKNMIDAFNSGQDFHSATAAKVHGVLVDKVSKDERSFAKAINFGIAYGMTAYGLAYKLNISVAEAKKFIDDYFSAFPMVKKHLEKSKAIAREKGYTETLMGRRRYLPQIHSYDQKIRKGAENQAMNTPVQGSSADLIKISMLRIHSAFQERRYRSKMMLTVHDELVFEVHKDETDEVQALVTEIMSSALKLNVPLLVESSIGDNWSEAH